MLSKRPPNCTIMRIYKSTAEPQNEEHGGGVTSSYVVMEKNPAYQPLETAAADLKTGTLESDFYILREYIHQV